MHAKTVGRLSGIFGLALAFVAVNATAPLAVPAAKATQAPQGSLISLEKPAHLAAQVHLDRFFDFAMSSAATHALPRVQVALDGKRIWVAPRSIGAQGFTGTVADPTHVHEADGVVTFSKDQVLDWTFFGRDRKMYGGFQTRAQLSRLSPQTAAPLLQVLAVSATPSEW